MTVGRAIGRPFTAAPLADPGRWLAGRPAAEAQRLVPRLFNLCAAAQSAASAAALGLPDPGAAAAMGVETVRDHGLALFHHWPCLMGEAPDRAGLAALACPDGRLAARICGAAGDISTLSSTDFAQWLASGETAAARLLARIRQETDPVWGRAALPPAGLDDLDAALDRPALLAAREATALDRVRRAPLMAALLMAEGPSLFARLVARVVDLLWALAGRADGPASGVSAGGAGFAQAARGLLAHKAELREGRVTAYRVLAPSAWNLAPGGLLERILSALPARRGAPMLARLAVSAVNPCVPVTLASGEGA